MNPLAVAIVAFVFWVFGRCCYAFGKRRHDLDGFARGCRFERNLAKFQATQSTNRPIRFFQTYN